MPKLVKLLNTNKMTLIVALPKNDPELAQAAIAGGADALQLQLDEKPALKEILRRAKIPVGLETGNKKQPTEKEIKDLVSLGFDFLNMKRDHLPDYYSRLKGVAKVMGLGNRFTIDLVLGVGEHGAQALDAAIIPVAEHGQELVVGDLQNYISIVISAGIPVIIPTQRSIKPSEVAIIADTDAKGLLLTPVVLGTTAKHIEQNVREFRVAVDDLG